MGYKGTFWRFSFVAALLLLVFHFSVAVGRQSSDFYFPKATEILHFQIKTFQGLNATIEHEFGRIYQMDNSTPPSSFFMTSSIGYAFFATLPFNSSLTISNMTLFVHHESTALVYTIFGYFDTNGNAYYYSNSSAPLAPGNTTDKITYTGLNIQLQQGQRLLVAVSVGAEGSASQFYFGDIDHDSWIQYDGTTVAVPEFSQAAVALLIFATCLMAVACQKKLKASFHRNVLIRNNKRQYTEQNKNRKKLHWQSRF